ncbi:hypothetical protein ACFQX6_26905 [Streptosporangium lutulentum]
MFASAAANRYFLFHLFGNPAAGTPPTPTTGRDGSCPTRAPTTCRDRSPTGSA